MYKVGVALTTLLAGTAFADLATTRIAPTAAYAPDSSSKTSPTYVINGSGFNATAGTHGTSNGNNDSVWRSGSAAWFVVDLGKVYSVADILIWNYNGSKNTNRGLRQIDVLFAVDESAYTSASALNFNDGKWVAVVSDHELQQASGVDTYAGESLALPSPKNARFIGIRIDTNYGGSERGLSEIRVDVVDETYSVALDGLSFDASQTSATFTGTMTATDGTGAEVFLAYGTEDAKMDLGTWENTASCGTQASGAQFTKTISGLAADKTYYGALFVLNQSMASSWSETTNFITGVVSVRMPPNFCEAETTKRHIVFTRPASCAAEPLEISYAISGDAAADYADQLTGAAVFAAGATEAAVELTPVKDTESPDSKTLTVTVQSGLYATDLLTSSGSVTIFDTAAVTAANPSWTGSASTMDWDTAGNWYSPKVPSYLDTVTIDASCSAESPVLVSQGDHAVAKVSLGSAAGGSGALDIASGANSTFAAASGLSVGAYGTGTLKISNGTVVSSGDNVYIGSQPGATGAMTVDGNLSLASGKKLYVGNSGSGMLTVKGGRISTSNNTSGDFIIGGAETGEGVLVMDGGTVSVAHAFIVGNSGHGVYTNLSGSVSAYKGTSFAKSTGSSAEVVFKGGSFSVSSEELTFGESGKCHVEIAGGTMTGRGVRLGANQGSEGIVYLKEGGTLRSSDNYISYFGASGTGVLYMRGGRFTHASSSAGFYVRSSASGYGLLSGWGTMDVAASKSSWIGNNGLVIADGRDDDGTVAERALTISVQDNAFVNGEENTTTNGWYAVNKGLLSVAHPQFSLAVGESGVSTWGEVETDEQIDLVNSARITFANITTAISSLTGKLYAPDRSDVPALPSGKEAVGVWKFDINGAYESATVEFRYDHVKAPRGVQMYQLNADGTTWTRLEPTLLEGYRAKVAVTDASRMFAAVAAKSGMSVIVR